MMKIGVGEQARGLNDVFSIILKVPGWQGSGKGRVESGERESKEAALAGAIVVSVALSKQKHALVLTKPHLLNCIPPFHL